MDLQDDEVRKLCRDVTLLRARACVMFGEIAVALYQLKQHLAEREILRAWAAELRDGNR